MDYRDEAPEILRDFLQYHEVVKGHSQATIDEYYLDLRTFFRFLKLRQAKNSGISVKTTTQAPTR